MAFLAEGEGSGSYAFAASEKSLSQQTAQGGSVGLGFENGSDGNSKARDDVALDFT